MVRRQIRKVRKARKVGKTAASAGRRRLVKTYVPFQPARNVGRGIYHAGKRVKQWATGRRSMNPVLARKTYQSRLASDNIVSIPAFKFGSPKKPSFAEKVIRLTNPPVIFKRNYQWSAECSSGRKGFFNIMINDLVANKLGGGGLYEDVMTQVTRRMGTDTSTADPTVVASNAGTTQQKYYVDYFSQALNMVNSGTNALVGKIKLFAYRRDVPSTFSYSGALFTPLNMAMVAANNGGNVSIDGGQEIIIGNYNFNTSNPGVNYQANYVMPGSAQNPGGATMNADLAFDVMGQQIKDFTGYYFREVKSVSFNLKPGQQIKHTTIFNDMPLLNRTSIGTPYLAGITYCMQIEFNAGIVGDATVTTGDNVISTGSGQLSCMLIEKRVVGQYQRFRAKLVMPTTAPAGIVKAAQFVINPDTGVGDIGYDEDV